MQSGGEQADTKEPPLLPQPSQCQLQPDLPTNWLAHWPPTDCCTRSRQPTVPQGSHAIAGASSTTCMPPWYTYRTPAADNALRACVLPDSTQRGLANRPPAANLRAKPQHTNLLHTHPLLHHSTAPGKKYKNKKASPTKRNNLPPTARHRQPPPIAGQAHPLRPSCLPPSTAPLPLKPPLATASSQPHNTISTSPLLKTTPPPTYRYTHKPVWGCTP